MGTKKILIFDDDNHRYKYDDMSSLGIAERVTKTVADWSQAGRSNSAASFKDDFDANSLDAVELVMALEAEFGSEALMKMPSG